MRSVRLLVVVVAALSSVFSTVAHAQSCNAGSAQKYFKPLTGGDGLRYPLTIGPLTWRLMGDPIQPVRGSDGATHLAYTLQFTNSWNQPVKLVSIQVIDPATDNAKTGTSKVLSIRNEDVTGQLRLLSLPQTQDKANYVSELPGGQSAVMYFDVTYPENAPIPAAISHWVMIRVDRGGQPIELTIISEPLPLNCAAPIVLQPPFTGDGWVNGNGCCKEIGPHRFVMNPINGALRPTEEFAIDWVRIDKQGQMFHGDPKELKNWYDYGADVLAVGPGTVVEVVRDVPEGIPGKLPENLPIAQVGGNRVIIDMGNGQYAEYEHLAPDSPTVHVGDYVRQGEKIGLLGDTGNSDAPHLHFQIMDRPSSLDGSALPFVFDHMRLEGRIPLSLKGLDDAMTLKENPEPVPVSKEDKPLTRAMPISLDVLGFD